MTVTTHRLTLKTKGNTDIVDITDEVAAAVRTAGVADGSVVVFVGGSTAGITTIEYEPGLLRDLKAFFEELAPQGAGYAHNHGGDSNGHAHVRAAVVGPSVAIPFENGRLALGTWQQVVLVDFDDRPRSREILVQVLG